MTGFPGFDVNHQPREIQLARQFYRDVLARGADRLAELDRELARRLLCSYFPATRVGGARETHVGLLGVSQPWRAIQQREGWLLVGYWAPADRAMSDDHWIVIAEAGCGRGVGIVLPADVAAADGDQVGICIPRDNFIVPTASELAEHLARHDLFGAVLAVETARDYLAHVTRWLAGRTSFGDRMIDNRLLRQRLAWAIVALRAADGALGELDMSLDARCAIAVSSAANCVRTCEKVHAGAGVFDVRPEAVYTIHFRREQDAERTLKQGVPPLGHQRPQLADQLRTALASVPLLRALPGELATAEAKRLVLGLEQICPAASATLLDELVVAESLAQFLPPGLTARVLVHRQVVRSYMTGPDVAWAAADLLAATQSGCLLAAIAVTERQTGSDLTGLAADVRSVGSKLVLNGVKTYVTGGADCDVVLVAAKRGAEIVLAWIDAHRPEISRQPLDSRAWRGARFAELQIHSYELSARDLHRGSGTAALLAGLARERMVVAAQQLSYARQWMTKVPPDLRTDLVNRVCAAQALLQAAVANSMSGEMSMVDASMAKAACCSVAVEIAEARAKATPDTRHDQWIDELMDDQADARAAACAGGTADLNLAIVEGMIMSILGTRNGEGQ